MKCPVCGTPLIAVKRSDSEINVCRNCGGLWLNQGELERLVMREAGFPIENSRLTSARPSFEPRDDREHRHPEEEHDHHASNNHRSYDERDAHGDSRSQGGARRGSWIANLLEGLGGGGGD